MRHSWIALGLALIVAWTSIAQALQHAHSLGLVRSGRAADHILVKFKRDAGDDRRMTAMSRSHLAVRSAIAPLDIQVLSIPSDQTPEQAIANLQAAYGSDIEFAEVDRYLYPALTPNDPDFTLQYHLAKIDCPAAWDTTTASGVLIAVADTGVEAAHP
ncbi:MAG TPA: hypothetical protein VMU17_02500, partial [Elusimicrobiota bacterium]|nr:hypothetical protein [Elusimicrobiota bacterium]